MSEDSRYLRFSNSVLIRRLQPGVLSRRLQQAFQRSRPPKASVSRHRWTPPNSLHPTDDDTTEEEFPAQPEDDDSTDDELVGAQPEDARSAVWYQSRAGHLAMAAGMFEPPIPFIDPAWRRPSSTTHCMTDSPFNPGVWNMPNTTAKTTPKSAKGAMPRTKNAVFKALLRDMHALQPDCLAPPMPLVRPRRSSAPEPVNLAIDLDIVVAAYAETKAAYDIYCDGLRGRLEALEPHVKSVTFHVLTDRLTMEKFPGFRANGLGICAGRSGRTHQWDLNCYNHPNQGSAFLSQIALRIETAASHCQLPASGWHILAAVIDLRKVRAQQGST